MPARYELLAQALRRDYPFHGALQLLFIERIEQFCRIAHNFGQGTAVAANHGTSDRHRLQGRDAEPFINRRIDECRRSCVELCHDIIPARDMAQSAFRNAQILCVAALLAA